MFQNILEGMINGNFSFVIFLVGLLDFIHTLRKDKTVKNDKCEKGDD